MGAGIYPGFAADKPWPHATGIGPPPDVVPLPRVDRGTWSVQSLATMSLPRMFVAPGADGRGDVLLQFASDTVCSLTTTEVAGGEARRQLRFGTWRHDGDFVEVEFDGVIARYEWSPDGVDGGLPPDNMLPQLAPEFRKAIGALPAAPFFEASAWATAAAASRPSTGPVARVFEAIFRLVPWWLRPALITPLALMAVVLVRGLLAVPSAKQLAEVGPVLGKVALAGIVAGAVPTLLWRPARRLGYVGSLLLGVVTVIAYTLACDRAFGLKATDSPLLFYGLSTFFGLVVGHSILHTIASASSQR